MLLADALRYPFRGERRLDTFAVGGVLGLAVLVSLRVAAALYPTVLALVPVALAAVPVLVLLGYVGRVEAATVAGVLATFFAFYAHVAAGRLVAVGATRAHER